MARSNPKPDPNEALTNRLLANIQQILAAGLPTPAGGPPVPTPTPTANKPASQGGSSSTAVLVPPQPPPLPTPRGSNAPQNPAPLPTPQSPSPATPNFPSQATATPAFPSLVNQPNLSTPKAQGPPNPNAPSFPILANTATPTTPHFPSLSTPASYQQIPPPPTPPQLTRRPKQRSRLGNALRPLTTRIKRAVGPRARKAFKGAAPHLARAGAAAGKSGTDTMIHVGAAVASVAAGPEAGAAVELLGKFAKGLGDIPGLLDDLSQSLHNTNMQFAEFSGAMATVKAERGAEEIALSRERGDRRAESAKFLSESQMDLKRVTAPIEDLGDVVKNKVVGLMDKFVARLLEPVAQAAEKFLNWIGTADPSTGIEMEEAVQDMWLDHRDEVDATAPRGWRNPRPRPRP